MKKVSILLTAVVIVCGIITFAEAALYDMGVIVYDDDRNLDWLKDANYADTSGYDAGGIMSWDEANTWIAYLNSSMYLGYNNWRLPTTTVSCFGTNCIDSEMGHLFYTELGNSAFTFTNTGPFINLQANDYYWSDTEYDTYDSWSFKFGNGDQDEYPNYYDFYAWAVRDHTTPIPEPSTIVLLASGLIGFIRFGKR